MGKNKKLLTGSISAIAVLCVVLSIIIVLNIQKTEKSQEVSNKKTVSETVTPEPSEEAKEEKQKKQELSNKKEETVQDEKKLSDNNEEKSVTAENSEDKTLSEKKTKQETNEKEETTKTDAVECNHSYRTRYGEVNAVTCPEFEFQYPDGWTITAETVSNDVNDILGEQVTLQNERGVSIDYLSFSSVPGYSSHSIFTMDEVTKAADSAFDSSLPPGGTDADYSSLGKFMVARIQQVAEYLPDVDEDFTPVDNGAVSYAVVPESYAGTREDVSEAYSANMYSVDYPTPYEFIAISPDGTFTEQEEREVIAILKSFHGC